MSQLETRDTLLNALITEFTDVELLYENKNKIPTGKEFIEAFFIPSTNMSQGKSVQNTQDEGVFQITVATSKGEYDTRQLTLVDRVQGVFGINTTLSYNGREVYITGYSVNAGRESGGFYKRDVSVEYLTFS